MATKKSTNVQKNLTTLDTEQERWTGKPLPVHPDLEMVQDRLGREATSSEEVEKVLAEIAAENKAKDAELDQHVKEAKAALKLSRGKTIDPARAREIEEERAATTVGSPVVLDGNLKPVTNKKTAKALVKAEKKPATPKKQVAKKPAAKTPKGKPALNPHGHAWITPAMVTQVFADKRGGMKNPEIATKHNISQGSVSTILSRVQWMQDYLKNRGMEVYPTL